MSVNNPFWGYADHSGLYWMVFAAALGKNEKRHIHIVQPITYDGNLQYYFFVALQLCMFRVKY